MNPKIPTYIVNLEKRKDRKAHVVNQFSIYPHFDVTIVKATEDKIPAIGLYKSLLNIIQIAHDQHLPYILFCEDDHQFTENFCFKKFYEDITSADGKSADLLLGGLSWFDYGVAISSDLYWINNFTGTQFIVIFSRFYDKILQSIYKDTDVIDDWISKLSDHILLSTPIISIQKDFGYSDVTNNNNQKGILNKYFSDTISRLDTLNEIYTHITNVEIPDHYPNDWEEMQIPTYVINLRKRPDRLVHITQQFKDRNEFDFQLIEACEHENGEIGLWESIKKIIQLAIVREEDIIIISEDDHEFTNDYCKKTLFNSIYNGAYLGADMLLGGISNMEQAIVVDKNLCWINFFQASQFVVLYSKVFQAILEEDFIKNDAADLKLSGLTSNKYVFHPFISGQKDFGYSDIPIDGFSTDMYRNRFNLCSEKLHKIRKNTIINKL